MTRLITLILLVLAYLAVGWLFYAQSIQIQKQDEQHQEFRSYIESHNKRLNVLEQRPELVIEEFKESEG